MRRYVNVPNPALAAALLGLAGAGTGLWLVTGFDSAAHRLLFSRILLVCGLAYVFLVAALLHRRTRRVLRDFFTARGDALNLAVFRIVVFWTLFDSVDLARIAWFSELPRVLLVPPAGLGWLLDDLPINASLAETSAGVVRIFALTAMIGLFSRTSAFLAVLFGLYALGIPQLFGKVNHDQHHLLWFGTILAASRCGDALSCDAVIKAWRRADRGLTEPPGPSRAYALPLRFVWLLFGIIYFFPGWAKWWAAGIDWALSDNLKYIMHSKWFEEGGWTPAFRIDRHPALYRAGGLATIIFEMSFIFLVFFPRLRVLAAFGGLAFHKSSARFLRIRFATLQATYVAFFDWAAIGRRIGRLLFDERMLLIYDGRSRLYRRAVASVRVFDVLDRVTYGDARDFEARELSVLKHAGPVGGLRAIVGNRSWSGLDAHQVWAARLPLAWPLLPFLHLVPVLAFARSLQRRPAAARTRESEALPAHAVPGGFGSGQAIGGVVAAGVFLIAGNLAAGVAGMTDGWPFARYPTFHNRRGPEEQEIAMVVTGATGESIPWDRGALQARFGTARFWGMIEENLRTEDPGRRQKRLAALLRLWAKIDPQVRDAATVRFYALTFLTDPDVGAKEPIRRELMLEMDVSPVDSRSVAPAPYAGPAMRGGPTPDAGAGPDSAIDGVNANR